MSADLQPSDVADDDHHDAAIEAVVRAHLDLVHAFAARRLGVEEAEDVCAEVFHVAAIAIRDGALDAVTPAWLITVCRNKVIDRWRKAARRRKIEAMHLPRRDELTSFPEDWYTTDHSIAVAEALDRLQPRHRAVLILHHVDGTSIAELADHTGMSVSAVESLLARARRAFRRVYREDE